MAGAPAARSPRSPPWDEPAAPSGVDAVAEPVWRRGLRSVAVSLEGDRVARRPSLAADLALIGRTAEEQAVDKLQTALFGAGLPVVLWLISTLGPPLPTGLVGLAVDRARNRRMVPGRPAGRGSRPARRRREFRVVLATYLRLVTVLLAGGSGIEEALQDAAGYGTGWGFSLLRRCRQRRPAVGRSPWSVMQPSPSAPPWTTWPSWRGP